MPTDPRSPSPAEPLRYRGRLAPSPTGYLHLGHASTFWTAQERCRIHHGTLILRNEDLDRDRCRPAFVEAMFDDLRWFGLEWQEGPDVGGSLGPYLQSARLDRYAAALEQLHDGGWIYPCTCSRRDILNALAAPHPADEEPIYPGTCRNRRISDFRFRISDWLNRQPVSRDPQPKVSWRFRVPDGETVAFVDGHFGPQSFVAGRDFGDFVVWRHDHLPAYQLAVVVDDAAMQITEVVRGADLLLSAARQLLLYRALNLVPPAFYHCPLLTDEQGRRLAKRHDARSLRTLRAEGAEPEKLRVACQ
jgi:glutamyl-tRNA synthetase